MRALRSLAAPLALAALFAAPVLAQTTADTPAPGLFDRLFGTQSAPAEETRSGGVLQTFLEDNLSAPGRMVRITGFAGALTGKATLGTLTVADDQGVWLTLKDVVLDWSRAALFSGKLDVAELSAGEIDLPRLPVAAPAAESALPSPEAPGFALPELPVSVALDKIAAGKVVLGASVLGTAAELSVTGNMTLAGGAGDASLAIERLDASGAISLKTSFANDSRVLTLDLSADEGKGGIIATLLGLPGQPALAFSAKGDGALSDWSADVRLATDGQDRLTGQIKTGPGEEPGALRLTAQLSGDIAPVFLPDYRPFFGNDVKLDAAVTRSADGATSIDRFQIAARDIALTGSAAIAPDGLPQKIALKGRVADPDGKPVLLPHAGTETRIASVDLTADFDADRGETWTANFRIAGLDRPGFKAETLALTGTGVIANAPVPRVTADVAFDARKLDLGDPAASQALGEAVTGKASVDWRQGAPVTVTGLTIDGESYGLSGNATIATTTQGPRVTGNARLDARRLAAFTGVAGRALGGSASLDLAYDATPLGGFYDISAKGSATDLAVGEPTADRLLAGQAELALTAKRDASGTTLDISRIATPVALITSQVNLRASDSSLVVDARLTDASRLLPGLPPQPLSLTASAAQQAEGWKVDAKSTGAGTDISVIGLLTEPLGTPGFDGTVDARLVDLAPFSALAGRTLSGAVQVHADGKAVSDLSSYDLTLRAESRDLKLDLPDLDPLLAGVSHASLSATGTRVMATIRDLTFRSPAMEVSAKGTLKDPLGAPAFDGTIDSNASDLSPLSAIAKRPLSGALTLHAEGSAAADLSRFDLTASAEGESVSLGIPDLDRLLAGKATASVSAKGPFDTATIGDLKVATPQLTLTADGTLAPGGGALNLDARLTDISAYVPDFAGPLTAKGTVGRESDGRLTADLSLTGPGGTTAAVKGTAAADASTADLAIAGSAPVGLVNRFIAPRAASGTAKFDLKLNGPPALASLSGRVTASGARLVSPDLGTGLNGIDLSVALAGGRADVSLKGQVERGGTLEVSGPVTLSAPYDADLAVRFDRAAFADPRLYETNVYGTAGVKGPLAGGARISGQLTLGKTNLQIPSTGLGGAGDIPPITHVGDPPAVRATRDRAGFGEATKAAESTGPAYPLDLKINAPNRIFLRGRGLDAEFGGQLALGGTTAAVIPSGGFDLVRGRLDILGKRLTLDQANIVMQGSFIPVVDIHASTRAEDVTVTVLVQGPALDPTISFTSQPELPQEEVLSRLLFGHGLETLSAFQAAQLALAVRTLAGKGGEGIIGKIRNKIGLADLDVTTDQNGQTAVRAGAYFGRKLYSDVTVGSTGDTSVNLNYDLTPSVTVKGSAGTTGDTSLGIFYQRDY